MITDENEKLWFKFIEERATKLAEVIKMITDENEKLWFKFIEERATKLADKFIEENQMLWADFCKEQFEEYCEEHDGACLKKNCEEHK